MIKFIEISEAVQGFHSDIAHRFFSGVGPYLQFIESPIRIKVMLGLKDLDIHVLPIHDAVLVDRTYLEMSLELMEQVFLDMTNVNSLVQVE